MRTAPAAASGSGQQAGAANTGRRAMRRERPNADRPGHTAACGANHDPAGRATPAARHGSLPRKVAAFCRLEGVWNASPRSPDGQSRQPARRPAAPSLPPDPEPAGAGRLLRQEPGRAAGRHPGSGLRPADTARHQPRLHHAAVHRADAGADLLGLHGLRCARPDRTRPGALHGAARSPGSGNHHQHHELHQQHECRGAGFGGSGHAAVHGRLHHPQDRGVHQHHLAREADALDLAAHQRLPVHPAARAHSGVLGAGAQRHPGLVAPGADDHQHRALRSPGRAGRPAAALCAGHPAVPVPVPVHAQHAGALSARADQCAGGRGLLAERRLGLCPFRGRFQPVHRHLFQPGHHHHFHDLAVCQLAGGAGGRQRGLLHAAHRMPDGQPRRGAAAVVPEPGPAGPGHHADTGRTLPAGQYATAGRRTGPALSHTRLRHRRHSGGAGRPWHRRAHRPHRPAGLDTRA